MTRAHSPQSTASPRAEAPDVADVRQPKLSREELERLGREGQRLRQEMQKQVDGFRKDPSHTKCRWL